MTVVVTRLWNSHPVGLWGEPGLDAFWRHLKTLLLNKAYPDAKGIILPEGFNCCALFIDPMHNNRKATSKTHLLIGMITQVHFDCDSLVSIFGSSSLASENRTARAQGG